MKLLKGTLLEILNKCEEVSERTKSNNMMEKQKPIFQVTLVCFQAVEAALKSITYISYISTEMTREAPTCFLFF